MTKQPHDSMSWGQLEEHLSGHQLSVTGHRVPLSPWIPLNLILGRIHLPVSLDLGKQGKIETDDHPINLDKLAQAVSARTSPEEPLWSMRIAMEARRQLAMRVESVALKIFGALHNQSRGAQVETGYDKLTSGLAWESRRILLGRLPRCFLWLMTREEQEMALGHDAQDGPCFDKDDAAGSLSRFWTELFHLVSSGRHGNTVPRASHGVGEWGLQERSAPASSPSSIPDAVVTEIVKDTCQSLISAVEEAPIGEDMQDVMVKKLKAQAAQGTDPAPMLLALFLGLLLAVCQRRISPTRRIALALVKQVARDLDLEVCPQAGADDTLRSIIEEVCPRWDAIRRTLHERKEDRAKRRAYRGELLKWDNECCTDDQLSGFVSRSRNTLGAGQKAWMEFGKIIKKAGEKRQGRPFSNLHITCGSLLALICQVLPWLNAQTKPQAPRQREHNGPGTNGGSQ